MKNTMNTLFSIIILVALPACCGSKKKNTKVQKEDTMVTIYNNVDTISIEKVNENEPVDQNQEEQETAFSKF